jgi:DNA repair ATPase RecN
LLQAVFAKQKESYINQLTKADAARQELQKSMRQMEDQLVRATAEVQQRRQQAADKGEDVDRQLSLLRKVRRTVGFPLAAG